MFKLVIYLIVCLVKEYVHAGQKKVVYGNVTRLYWGTAALFNVGNSLWWAMRLELSDQTHLVNLTVLFD